MEMHHGSIIPPKSPLHLLASPLRTLRCLLQPYAWIWLEKARGDLDTSSFRLVLFSGMSGLFLNASEEVTRHG